MKAMILDDDPLIRSMVARMFHGRGYEVVTYPNPTACPLYMNEPRQCLIDGSCPSVIVSDYEMPFVNGVEFIEALRGKGCSCPHVALLSGYLPDRQFMDRIAKLDVTFFPKPVHRSQIHGWLDRVESTRPSTASGQAASRL